jgi:hypothetical protein
MSARWKLGSAMIAMGVASAILLGCSETLPLASLPDLSKLPEKVLSKDEQEKAMNQMIEKGQTSQAEAVKQIEKGK